MGEGARPSFARYASPVSAQNEAALNLTDENVSRRLRVGILSLALALGLAVTLQRLGASTAWRAALFLPFFVSTTFFFQGAFQTCGYSALAGQRHTRCGVEKIADPDVLREVRARGLKQLFYSILSALGLTTLFVLAS